MLECLRKADKLFVNLTMLDANNIDFETNYSEQDLFFMNENYFENYNKDEIEIISNELSNDLIVTNKLINKYL